MIKMNRLAPVLNDDHDVDEDLHYHLGDGDDDDGDGDGEEMILWGGEHFS